MSCESRFVPFLEPRALPMTATSPPRSVTTGFIESRPPARAAAPEDTPAALEVLQRVQQRDDLRALPRRLRQGEGLVQAPALRGQAGGVARENLCADGGRSGCPAHAPGRGSPPRRCTRSGTCRRAGRRGSAPARRCPRPSAAQIPGKSRGGSLAGRGQLVALYQPLVKLARRDVHALGKFALARSARSGARRRRPAHLAAPR